MIDWLWIKASSDDLLMVALSGIGIYIALLLLTRISGLRSFSKMSSFDFAITVAFGSVVASTMMAADPALLQGVGALVVLYLIQYMVSKFRCLATPFERVVDNKPILLMAREKVLAEHLQEARMTEDDLRTKLRMAGVTHPSQVLAVIFEMTGDVAVMKRNDQVDPWLFQNVRGIEHLSLSSAAE